jgi:hypothetical protein
MAEKERKTLALAFKRRTLYVGAVRWPEATVLLECQPAVMGSLTCARAMLWPVAQIQAGRARR